MEPVALSAIVWTEFLCGPVTAEQIAIAVDPFPNPEPFLSQDSHVAAEWFNRTGRRRGSLTDCMVAAVAFRVRAPRHRKCARLQAFSASRPGTRI